MRESRTSGSVRGASGNGRPYRERGAVVVRATAEVRYPSRFRSLMGQWAVAHL
jgi:hypothetical protein